MPAAILNGEVHVRVLVYVRPRPGRRRVAARKGHGAAQNAGGHAGGSSGNCGRQFYAEGRVLGSRTRLICRLPL